MKKLLRLIILASLLCPAVSAQSEKGRISGLAYIDYLYNIERDPVIDLLDNTVLSGEKDFNAFQLRRVYFTYDYNISEKFSTRFRLEADQNATVNNGKIGVMVKDAYIKWKNLFKGSDLILGIQPGPAFVVSEDLWGYRSLEKTILDLRGIVSSRDFGITLKGKITSDGLLYYWIMAGNSSGNAPEVDKYKRLYAHLHFIPIKNISFTLYGDYKAQPDIQDPLNPGEEINNNAITYALFGGYQGDELSLGAEVFMRNTQNNTVIGNSLEAGKTLGISLFGSYYFSDMFGVVGRYDYFDPFTNENFDGDSRQYIIAALNFMPDEKVSIMPNVQMETYENIGGLNIDPSITGRITVYYKFL